MSWESGKYKKEGSIGVETDLKLAFSHHGEAKQKVATLVVFLASR